MYYIYFYEQETSVCVCVCCTVTIKQKTQSLFEDVLGAHPDFWDGVFTKTNSD